MVLQSDKEQLIWQIHTLDRKCERLVHKCQPASHLAALLPVEFRQGGYRHDESRQGQFVPDDPTDRVADWSDWLER